MSSTFENLPDEILMIIFQYSDTVFNILRTYLGLNQRLNNILLDKRLHLLTDFLQINVRNDYYNSEIFQQISQQLLSINTTIDEEKLDQLFQPLLSFHIKQKYIDFGKEIQSSLVKFASIRQQLSSDELVKMDHELKTQFDSLHNASITMETIEHIQSLVLTNGARLECDDYELGSFNLAKAVNKYILSNIISIKFPSPISINSFLKFFQTVIISNISLLNNRDYVGNGGCKVEYFLIYTLYRLQYFYDTSSSEPLNMEYYRAAVDLFLFVLQCSKHMLRNDHYIMFDILEMVSKIHNTLFIRTVQSEILQIVVDEYATKSHESWDDYLQDRFRHILTKLFENRRLDIIKYIYCRVKFEEIFNEPNHFRKCVNLLTKNQMERRYFSVIMDDESFDFLFSRKRLIFILLDKKERKLSQKLLKLSPRLIDQLDEDGNDPLLYISLKVSGCRHRIVEMLIKMGSDLERRNFKEQNFMEILQLQRNRKLFQKLTEHEILKVDI